MTTSLNKDAVLVGAPDQLTTGAIACAAVGSTLPTDATTALGNAFTPAGYVSKDGLSFSPSLSTNDIEDWDCNIIRKLVDKFEGPIQLTMYQTDEQTLKLVFGDSNVVKTAASSSHGVQLKTSIGARLPDRKAWVFNMKDGSNRIRIVLPDAQVTNWGQVNFKKNDAIGWQVTLTPYPDASGNNVYIYTDDGNTTS